MRFSGNRIRPWEEVMIPQTAVEESKAGEAKGLAQAEVNAAPSRRLSLRQAPRPSRQDQQLPILQVWQHTRERMSDEDPS